MLQGRNYFHFNEKKNEYRFFCNFKYGGCVPAVEWSFFNLQDIIHGVC